MEKEISLRELFLIFRKHLLMIILLVIASVVISAFISFYILDEEFTAYTTLMVGKPKDYSSESELSYNDVLLNQKLVSTYGELIKTRKVSDIVISDMELPISFEEFKGKVNVSLVKNTEIIQIQVTDNNPQLATDIANHTANVFMETVQEIMKVENVQVIDEAQMPKSPVKPRPLVNISIAAVLGFMLGVIIAFLREYLDNTIKTPEDVDKYLGLPVLGMIPKEDNWYRGV